MRRSWMLTLLPLWLGLGCSDDPPPIVPDPRLEVLGRCAGFNALREPYFGDTHVHTRLSLDANLQGNRLSPVDAYRFARGEEVGIQPYDENDQPLRSLQLDRPLDFVALSDHAEFLGLVKSCIDPTQPAYESSTCAIYRDSPDESFINLNVALATPQGLATAPSPCDPADGGCPAAQLSAWGEVQQAAEMAYDRSDACSFTTFVGYEWSGSPGTLNLHRNVIFRNHVVPDTPTSYFDENEEEGLWARLRAGCLDADNACDVLTIPHNSNLSSGLMFETVDGAGEPFDADYARERQALEPLIEVFQHKGDSECLPGAPAGDEACDFEKLPYTSLATANLGGDPEEPLAEDFLRHALGEGMRLEATLGHNPFAYGVIASTDTHLGTPGAVAEDAFVGHGGAGLTVRDELPVGLPDRVWFNPGGLAVLWAEENSREALFSAMRRREAYGTSGPRIVLRFFGGWGYDEALCDDADLAAAGYADGVPMGALLPPRDGAAAPRFVVSSMRDPQGQRLAQLQIVKGSLSGQTVSWEVFDVAGDATSGGVDTTTCEPLPGGSDSLCQVWTDPTFVADRPALYYARVLETPSCRWHAYLCNQGGVDCADPSTITEGYEGCCDWDYSQRERAWSSPIWYAP